MPVFENDQLQQLQDWNSQLAEPVEIELIVADHTEDKQIGAVGNTLQKAAPRLHITRAKTENRLPGFRLKENIQFSALPLQKEFEPFLQALSYLNGDLPQLPENIQSKLDTIDMPVMLKLYIALACPHCPAMVKTVIPLAIHCDNIHLDIIDGTLFSEEAQKDRVMSAPCLILDDDFRWTEYVDAEEITDMITQRDPSRLGARTLRTILENGDAEWVVDQMIEKGMVFNSFYQLLLHETWSVRLGAMVVVEDLGSRAPDIAETMCPKLMEVFEKYDVTIQGDIIYALGEAGSTRTREWIQDLLPSLEHDDLIDAAEDALESLDSRI